MKIRPYESKDYEACRDICQATSTIPSMSKELLCTLYCEYYIESEPQNCFVLADDNDVCVGYILCAEDFKRYKKQFNQTKMPQLKRLSRKQAFLKRINNIMDGAVAKKYPAHLHIDLLEQGRSKGYGSQMIQTLLNHLKDKGVKGVSLGVGSKNVKAQKFYQKNGFTLYRDYGNAGKIYVYNLTGVVENK